jgi:pyruvate formate lyase activating enzyme
LSERQALLWESISGKNVKCSVCPRRCTIAPGKRGFCRVRENRDGTLYTLVYGLLTALAVDPIEKKPLFNFWPGSSSLSISTVSCNFRCPWCQNWSISQTSPEEVVTDEKKSEEIVRLARRYGCKSISYTYNEPTIWFEYVLETSRAAKEQGILNVLVTNGYITKEAVDALAPYVDAANVDVKGFTEEFYQEYCMGSLKDVLAATEHMHGKGMHVETTNLIIPKLNDSFDDIKKMCEWHKETLGVDTPIHFSRFYPQYKMTDIPVTPVETLISARKVAKETGLNYVYIGNVPGEEGENTYCPNCGNLLVRRIGFDISTWNLSQANRCSRCNTEIAIVGRFERSRPPSQLF